MDFRKYYTLHQKYTALYDTIIESYIAKGYFGKNIDTEEISRQQYKWFNKVIFAIEHKLNDTLEPFILNANNKLTREFYDALTGHDLKSKGKKEIKKYFEENRWKTSKHI